MQTEKSIGFCALLITIAEAIRTLDKPSRPRLGLNCNKIDHLLNEYCSFVNYKNSPLLIVNNCRISHRSFHLYVVCIDSDGYSVFGMPENEEKICCKIKAFFYCECEKLR